MLDKSNAWQTRILFYSLAKTICCQNGYASQQFSKTYVGNESISTNTIHMLPYPLLNHCRYLMQSVVWIFSIYNKEFLFTLFLWQWSQHVASVRHVQSDPEQQLLLKLLLLILWLITNIKVLNANCYLDALCHGWLLKVSCPKKCANISNWVMWNKTN